MTNEAVADIVALQKLRVHGEFCDVKIKLSDTERVYGHKAILASASPYFEGMFTSAFREAETDCVDFRHMADDTVTPEHLIDTFYGKPIEINQDNVLQILNFATLLSLEDLNNA